MKIVIILGLYLCICMSNAQHFFSSNREFQAYPDLKIILVNPQDKTQMRFYNYDTFELFVINKWFVRNRKSVIYAFGFMENIESATTQAILDAYVQLGDCNIFIIDWSAYNGVTPDDYQLAIQNMKKVGTIAGKLFFTAMNSMDLFRTHLLGHSLGAHLMEFFNRAFIYNISTRKAEVIIALDPAGPYMYDPLYNNEPLNETDARYVQVVHTDMMAAGAPVKCGTIDFYANGGGEYGVQPGCPAFDATNQFAVSNLCSHQRSVYYYAEALKSENGILAVKCDSYENFTQGTCDRYRSALKDFYNTDFGDYYFQTNAEPPYNRGYDGMIYSSNL